MTKLKYLLTSRKFWAALIGFAMIIIKQYSPDFPLSEESLVALVVIVVGYILGTAVEDSGRPTPPA